VDDYYFVEKNPEGHWCVFKTQGEGGLGEKEMVAEFQDEMSASIHAAVSQADVHQTSRDISLGDGSNVRAWPVERPGPGVGVRVVQSDGTNRAATRTEIVEAGFPSEQEETEEDSPEGVFEAAFVSLPRVRR
jgi:hypothetical protein